MELEGPVLCRDGAPVQGSPVSNQVVGVKEADFRFCY